jgi:hypothetical protein
MGIALALAPWAGIDQVGGQTAPERLTTDTPEYCVHLITRLREAETGSQHRPPQEALTLSDEGRQMCDHGETRGGIQRLRRAMRLILSSPAP